jgi:hypothetical protein
MTQQKFTIIATLNSLLVSYGSNKINTMNHAAEVLMPISILGSFGAALYFFTKVLTDYVLKKKMIEKGYVNEDTQAIFKTSVSDNRFGSLKW